VDRDSPAGGSSWTKCKTFLQSNRCLNEARTFRCTADKEGEWKPGVALALGKKKSAKEFSGEERAGWNGGNEGRFVP